MVRAHALVNTLPGNFPDFSASSPQPHDCSKTAAHEVGCRRPCSLRMRNSHNVDSSNDKLQTQKSPGNTRAFMFDGGEGGNRPAPASNTMNQGLTTVSMLHV